MGPTWFGFDWLAWRVFVKTLFGQSLETDEEREVYQRCTGLQDTTGPYTEAWLPIGRRGGKSRVLAMIAVFMATCFDWRPYLAPGQFGYVSVLSDSKAHAGEIMNYVKGALQHQRLAGLVKRDLAETVELDRQVRIQVVTASIKAVRARTVIAALCDEIAFWESDEEAANPDIEILRGLRPAMATIPNALLACASSRYARKGALWDAYRDHYAKPTGPLVWSADTLTMHPSIDQAFIDSEYERDPVAAAAEYGLDWRADIAEFINRERVAALVVKDRHELPYTAGLSYYAFVDPSGGSGEDSFTLAIAHRDPKSGFGVLDLLREVQPPFNTDSVADEFAVTLKGYRLHEVTGDRYGGDWPGNRFRQRGIAYKTSEDTASDIYQEALALLNSGRAELLDDKRFINQVCALERRTSRLGKDTISHPMRGHDDVANVGLGALVLAAGRAGATTFSSEQLMQLRGAA